MKNYVLEEAKYVQIEEKVLENVEPVDEKKTWTPHLSILIDSDSINEKNISAKISKTEFRNLFGKDAKPHKGDAISIENLGKKFKINKFKKFKAKSTGKKEYKLQLKSTKESK